MTYSELEQIAVKHGYVKSHDVEVVYPEGRITHHCFTHSVVCGVEGLLLGVWLRDGKWYFDAHKSGSGQSHIISVYSMDAYLKGHVARATRRLSRVGHCTVCGRDCTKKSWLVESLAKYGNVCSQHCSEVKNNS